MTYSLPDEIQGFVREWQERINQSEVYAEKGTGWGRNFNGGLALRIEPDDEYSGEPFYVCLSLENGACISSSVSKDASRNEYGFVISGKYGDWKQLIQTESADNVSLRNGPFRIDGDTDKLNHFSTSLQELAACGLSIKVEFKTEG